MSNPQLLMLDEPSLGLAPLVVDQLYDTIGALKAEGLTILLVEQQVYGALELADRAYVLETGRIVREGNRADSWPMIHPEDVFGPVGGDTPSPSGQCGLSPAHRRDRPVPGPRRLAAPPAGW